MACGESPKAIFVYEYITGGGLFAEANSPAPAGSLLVEGAAMLRAVVGDLLRLANTNVITLRDRRLEDFRLPGCEQRVVAGAREEESAFREAAAAADLALIIAPEIGGALLARCGWAEAVDARLMSPGADFVAAASNKQLCATRLRAAGVNVPDGVELACEEPLPAEFDYPAVLKPVDGAGSVGVQLVASFCQVVDRSASRGRWRLERYCPGIAASVAVLSGPAGVVVLPTCRQRLSNDGRFQYLGGIVAFRSAKGNVFRGAKDDIDERAELLAHRAVAALPPAVGYFGLDIVLGQTARDDVVIEVNPRLTTSYVGYRALANENLARAMLAVVAGEECSLSFSTGGLEFDADGKVRSL